MRSHIFRTSSRRPPIFGAEHYKIRSFCEEFLVIFGYFCCVLSVRRAGLHCKVNVAGLSESASDFSDFVFRLFSPPPPLEFLHFEVAVLLPQRFLHFRLRVLRAPKKKLSHTTASSL